ncbi:phosphatase [Clostridium sp.]|uniref:phosphatase n=1 Tax=Clostridium sp. TaxID=1506 RepID=UPI001A3CCFFD|nr:phosphatase [Clostridium sp.]MBK5239624.1 phosphatase [Clostridium sp.]
MKYVVDVHTHTIVSGHAYTTLLENVREAKVKGIKILGTSEHGPKMPGGPHMFYFGNIRVIPRVIYGVTILRGCEANIMDYDGKLDIPDYIEEKLDFIIASLHDVCVKPGNEEENTRAILGAMDNPNVHIIGHSGNPVFSINREAMVKKALEKDIIIELNNSSLKGSRVGSEGNCKKIALLCKEYGVKMIIGSDAHTCFDIGGFDLVNKLLEEINMPEKLIMNSDENKLLNYLKEKGKIKEL